MVYRSGLFKSWTSQSPLFYFLYYICVTFVFFCVLDTFFSWHNYIILFLGWTFGFLTKQYGNSLILTFLFIVLNILYLVQYTKGHNLFSSFFLNWLKLRVNVTLAEHNLIFWMKVWILQLFLKHLVFILSISIYFLYCWGKLLPYIQSWYLTFVKVVLFEEISDDLLILFLLLQNICKTLYLSYSIILK